MRRLNNSGNRQRYNRHYLESIEVTRRNTAKHPPLTALSTANSAKRRPTAPPFTKTRHYAYVPSNRINQGLFLMAVTTHTILTLLRYQEWPISNKTYDLDFKSPF